MKKLLVLSTLFILLLTSCNNGHKFTLNGKFDKLAVDTIVVYYHSPYFKLDTIIAKKGKFEYSIPADTTTIFSLILNHNKELPIFAYKDGEATISGTADNIIVEGEEDNLKMNEILKMENKLKKDTAKIESWIESYAKKNPTSFTNIYLINKYFVQRTNPDYKRIDAIMANLNGSVKDVPSMVSLQKTISQYITNENISIGSISVPDKNGVFPMWNTLNDKVSLITFWASWDKESKAMQDSLVNVKKKFTNADFQIISISLDINKETWKSYLPQDTVRWQQLCDFKGWDNSFVKQANVTKLPYNILLDKNKKIIASDIYGKELNDKIKQALTPKKKK